MSGKLCWKKSWQGGTLACMHMCIPAFSLPSSSHSALHGHLGEGCRHVVSALWTIDRCFLLWSNCSRALHASAHCISFPALPWSLPGARVCAEQGAIFPITVAERGLKQPMNFLCYRGSTRRMCTWRWNGQVINLNNSPICPRLGTCELECLPQNALQCISSTNTECLTL